MVRTRVEELDLDGFLGHKGSGGGTGSFLGNWKEDGSVVVWLHPKAKIIPLWSHQWHRIGKDFETKDPEIWSMRFNSMERESVLKRFTKRDEKTEERLFPPEICPFSLFLEWVYQAIVRKEISWVDEVFCFDEGKDPVILHAGGILGMFNVKDDELTEDEIKELRKARIRRDEAWKESCKPRLQYIFRVVSDVEPSAGCLVALEASSLGDAVKRVIGDRIDDVGREKGDPFTTPYAIKWAYDDRQTFSKKYAARPMLATAITPEIQELFDKDPPSIDDLIKESNILELRQSFEAHWCLKHITPPWDEIFKKAEEELEGTEAMEDPTDFPYGANVGGDAAEAENLGHSAAAAEAEEEGFECDLCKTAMDSDQFECSACGQVYDPKSGKVLTAGEWPKKEKPKSRSRSGRGK